MGLFIDIVETNEYAKFYTLSLSLFFAFVFICLFVLPLEYGADIYFLISPVLALRILWGQI